MNKQDQRFEALETLIADGQREIIRRLSWLEEHSGPSGSVTELPSIEAWTEALDRHLLLQRTAFVSTIRGELPQTLVTTARSLRARLRFLTVVLVIELIISSTHLVMMPGFRALIERLL